MKNKIFFAMVLMVCLFSLSVFSQEKKESMIDAWIYFQPQWDTATQAFSISKGRGFITGQLSLKISYLTEIETFPSPQLMKAQLAYSFNKNTQIILGQQSNTFKFYNPDPGKRIVINYPLRQLIPGGVTDDLGITLQGKISKFVDYRFSVLNGTGANKKDDNKEKDLVMYSKFSPSNWLSLYVCWQGGWQGTEKSRQYRSGEWLQADIKPISKLVIRPTWVRREDSKQEGWFIQSLLQVNSKYQLLIQYLNDYNKEKELTIGGIFYFNKRLRLLPNISYRKGHGLETYLMLHYSINKDI